MIVNIINKHGVMPKKCFPESFSSENSAHECHFEVEIAGICKAIARFVLAKRI